MGLPHGPFYDTKQVKFFFIISIAQMASTIWGDTFEYCLKLTKPT